MRNKWFVVVVSAAIIGILLINTAIASSVLQIQVNVVPFQWKVHETTFSSNDSYNNGKHFVPSSLSYNGTMYIPIRLLAETLGYQVGWDAVSRTATVDASSKPSVSVSAKPDTVSSAAKSMVSGNLKSSVLQIQVNIVPFQWKVNDETFSSNDSYNNGKYQVPSSLCFEGTMYIPIRLLAETLGYQVDWDAVSRTATVKAVSNPDDPTLGLPDSDPTVPRNKYLLNKAVLNASTPLLVEPTDTSAVMMVLLAGSKVSVMEETSQAWIKVTNAAGQTGYITPVATDYRVESSRPEWEQKADDIITFGLKYLGTEYEFDASLNQTDTFDCSSFMNYIFGQKGYKLPRNSRQQSQLGTEVQLSELRKGDLLFFTTSARKNKTGTARIGHVAIYIGDNYVLQTYRVGIGVTITELEAKWTNRVVVVKRLI